MLDQLLRNCYTIRRTLLSIYLQSVIENRSIDSEMSAEKAE